MATKKRYDIIFTRQVRGRPIEPLCFIATIDEAERRLLRIPRATWGTVAVWDLDKGKDDCLLYIDFQKERLASPANKTNILSNSREV